MFGSEIQCSSNFSAAFDLDIVHIFFSNWTLQELKQRIKLPELKTEDRRLGASSP
jgi:hypothetical protein